MAAGWLGTIQSGQSTQSNQLAPVTDWELFTTFDSPPTLTGEKKKKKKPTSLQLQQGPERRSSCQKGSEELEARTCSCV